MECNNCGYNNRDNASTCEKCGKPLSRQTPSSRSTVVDGRRGASSSGSDADGYVGSKTIRDLDLKECDACHYKLRPESTACPNCGKTLGSQRNTPANKLCPMCHRSCQLDAIFCPYCGSDFGSNANVPGGRPTVRPGDMMPRPSCRLKAIPRDNENIQNGTLTFTGERVILNRANTEETNQTITSKEQAILVCEGGKWYIQDRSEYKTTFIHTAERIELKQGDVIMLGNRRFVFEAD